ncbi:hypothetical protein ABFX02_13G064800 [Erythranthe guttata]
MKNYFWIIFLFCNQSTAEPTLVPCCTNPSHRVPPSGMKLNYHPIIGIISHPGDGASGRLNNSTKASYIAASYVKFVESGGARVIPLIYNEPPEILNKKLNLVNGVLFPGGSIKRGHFFDVVESIFKNVVKKNDGGDHFPLLAVCLGFELLAMIVSKDKSILEEFSARDYPSTLMFPRNINLNGTAFERFPPYLLQKMAKENIVMEHHHYGVSPEKFHKNKNLSNFFKIVTTSTCKNRKVYVSTIQARKYPVTGFQWHPEKNAYEWGLPGIPHSESAIQVTQNTANFFVRESRKSSNRPSNGEVLDKLIYNYKPTYCGKAGRGFESFDQVYIFS